ncbi:CysRS, partial [Symbiodinium pilosum]
LRHPPACNNCDHRAWREIFRGCGFHCSYFQRLQNVSMTQGLELESWRARWEILKMMHNMRLWNGTDRVLTVSLQHFRANFDGTVQCIVRFLSQGGPRRLHGRQAEALISELRALGRESRSHGARGAETAAVKEVLRRDVMDRQPYLQKADRLFDRLMASGGSLGLIATATNLLPAGRSAFGLPAAGALEFVSSGLGLGAMFQLPLPFITEPNHQKSNCSLREIWLIQLLLGRRTDEDNWPPSPSWDFAPGPPAVLIPLWSIQKQSNPTSQEDVNAGSGKDATVLLPAEDGSLQMCAFAPQFREELPFVALFGCLPALMKPLQDDILQVFLNWVGLGGHTLTRPGPKGVSFQDGSEGSLVYTRQRLAIRRWLGVASGMDAGYLQKAAANCSGVGLDIRSGPALGLARANGRSNGTVAAKAPATESPPATAKSSFGADLLGKGFERSTVTKGSHPPWLVPNAGHDAKLQVMNSLTGEKEPFRPLQEKKVIWYTCGPTVYDVAHMGHARAYLTFDILRRIMMNYLGFEVKYQINITDIDDKIILRARQNKLFDDFSKEASKMGLEELKKVVTTAVELKGKKLAAKEPQKPAADASAKDQQEYTTSLEEHQLKLRQHSELEAKIKAAFDSKKSESILAAAREVLMEKLDKERGHTVTDHSIFDAHGRRFEEEYFEDMDALGVLRPDVVTRITEYMDGRVQKFIEKLEEMGVAYGSAGSVYFDIASFQSKGHDLMDTDSFQSALFCASY